MNKEVVRLLEKHLSEVIRGSESKLEIGSLPKDIQNLGENINLLTHSLFEKKKKIVDNEKEFNSVVSSLEKILNKVRQGDLAVEFESEKLGRQYQTLVKGIDDLLKILKDERLRSKEREDEIKNSASSTGKLLDRVIQGHFSVRIDTRSNIRGVEKLKKKLNSVIESLEFYTIALSQSEEKIEESKKYFKEYSKRAIELADSWGMGEVFKHEMEEWVKKRK
ncbi:MAG TPA: hypothetical protein HA346_04080 [Thermoplasmata archaeon]|nr:hypothetical protein [Thermoplasmata archaeon]